MERRLELQAILLGIPEVSEVYFQPPSNVSLQYPCIVYNREDEDTAYADNLPYRRVPRYEVTIIDRNPDSGIPDYVGAMPLSSFNRAFTQDNLHHTVYQLYF